MKNNIVFKFLAIVLCAASLVAAVGSGAGMFLLTEMDLYNRTVEDAYDEMVENRADSLAYNMGIRYASGALGGCNTQLVDNHYYSGYDAIFDMSKVSYVLTDSDGNILQEQMMDDAPVYSFTFPVRGRYIRLVEEITEEEWNRIQQEKHESDPAYDPEGYVLYDAVPAEGTHVYNMTVTFLDGSSEGIGSDEPFGFLSYDEEGWLICRFYGNIDPVDHVVPATVTHITFKDAHNNILFEAKNASGVGELFYEGDLQFQGNLVEMYAPEVEETASGEIGARAVVRKKTPIWWLDGTDFEKSGTYYGKNYEITIYATEVYEGVLYGCTSRSYLTGSAYHSDWVAIEDVVFTPYAASSGDRGQSAVCNTRTQIWALDGAECYDTGMYYQKGQEIGILVLGTFDSGEWGMTDLGWVRLEDVTLLENIAMIPEQMETAVEATAVPAQIPSTDPTQAFSVPAATEDPVTAAEEVTMPPYQTDTANEPSVAMEETLPYIMGDDAEYTRYYNQDLGAWMMAEVAEETIPEGYTIRIRLAEGAVIQQYEWEAFRLLYNLRKELPIILGVSLLLFAVLSVYLCCAAGRKPGTEEVHPAGLNCIPMDLYAALAVSGVFGLLVLVMEATPYFLDRDILVGVIFLALCAFAAGLLIVGFCFACAAQFKTPGGYWWRHSLCGLVLWLIGKCCQKLLRFARWVDAKWDTKLWPRIVKLVKGIIKVLKALFKQIGQWLKLLAELLQKSGDWLGKKLNRFFSLLPLTWQWLLAGGAMIFFLFITVAGRYDGWIVVSVIFGFALILYGAQCFGTLLESTRRMSKGDLDEKVDDKLMTGAFKDFADDLNSLADVAVVAAQKQLKSERMKTELITNVSHDIKTPLTSIINYVDLLQKPHTEEDEAKYLEVLSRQSLRLKKLIDDLMEMSKASTGNLSVDITVVDAGEAVNQALGEFADKLEKAQLYPVFRQPEKQVLMMADGRLVWRVMSNLLSNAVKYALPGTRLYVDMQKLDSKVIISLKNISREELNVNADELLERFVRGDASRNTEGSGLGLNIAQSLMELQKGQLQILVDGDLFKVTLIFPAVE